MSRDDLELARVVIAGSGVDSGEPDYRIACEDMSRVCGDPVTKRCVLDALDHLRRAVAESYGPRVEPFVDTIADHLGYTDLRRMLMGLPGTWYPDLLRAMVEAAYAKGVFRPEGASGWVRNLENRLGPVGMRAPGTVAGRKEETGEIDG